MIFTAEDAESVVQAARFHPLGKRGFAPAVRAAEYGFFPVNDFVQYTNEQILTIGQIENLVAARNLPEILSTQGLDVVFIGPADLSQAVGTPGHFDNPELQQIISSIIKQCIAAGMPVGIVTGTVEGAREWIDKGVTYLTLASTAVLRGYSTLATDIRSLL
jgi:4-hydroxy-2-oxoheptanedioate aldolase